MTNQLIYNLNQNRILIGRVVLTFAFIVNLMTTSHSPDTLIIHHIFDSLGLIMLVTCILGRIYCTLQIGGHKNASLVNTGIYSVVRNPLYFFSFIGTLGIGVVSNQITVCALIVASFFIVYLPLIAREEKFLSERFGATYTAYLNIVPRLIPNFSLYRMPSGPMTVNLDTLHSALRDALWWLLPFIVFETIEWAQQNGLIHSFGTVW
jgi:protein-S-isoprenylcysteine O-methyltransferase Ste14